ncbi:glutathione S-transferase T3-like [Eutrema salsugineum]|uniref:glutathione S-transferase T3-like n=1 Tax=Eutrema salsugineum TaxID=72664 RepID=UPI000CED2D43|nr:glutathione S-transferase T3-like [Eutrema salsugineum]
METTIALGDSQPLVFETQWTDAPSPVEETVKEKRSRRPWTPTEDLVLISAWLNTSKDPIIGNGQRADAFWSRIAIYYAASNKISPDEKRGPINCKQRWSKLNECVCKFIGSFEAASAQKTSGQNENDVMKLALDIYYNDYKHKFTMEHAWRELRHDQKWRGSGMSKKKRTEEEQAFSHGENEGVTRPPGVKAAKGKKNQTKGKAESVEVNEKAMDIYRNIWEIREKELALKDKTNKQQILANLLGRTDPLTPMEVELKNNLISEMLSK